MYNKIDIENSSRDPGNNIVINHLDNIKNICTKDKLILSLRKYYEHTPPAIISRYSVFNTTPTTFVVQSNCSDPEFNALSQRYKELFAQNYANEKIPAKHCEKNMWLVKPCGQNQGRGIEIFSNIKQFFEYNKE